MRYLAKIWGCFERRGFVFGSKILLLRGKPRKSNAKFMDCHAVFQKTARNDDFLFILIKMSY